MDTLSKVLNTLEFDSNFYFSVRFTGSWGITVPPYARVARFHICCAGESLFRIDGVEEVVELNLGDILIIPHGASHTLLSEPGADTMMLDDAYTRANYRGSKVFKYDGTSGDAYCELLCGHFEFQHTLPHPFIDQLPSYILLRKSDSDELRWLKEALIQYTREPVLEQAGNSLIIKHLSEITFTLAIQSWQKTQNKSEGFIAAISDAHLSNALKAFHENPQVRWTVEDLASAAAMSRTRFVEHFSRTVKMPPIQYIKLWRMTKAQKFLRTSNLSTEQIANQCGYESTTAFSKAFKRFTSQTPAEFRRLHKLE
ncbi:MAG: AraC family transcriptional regulator [Pseudomonadota bacterium]